ncbi:hypothetical protein DPV78_011735 [Talaromyces pinophilus]|nr:hypothetical protein DPV78_011735 [Talaromyces pinophilus]
MATLQNIAAFLTALIALASAAPIATSLLLRSPPTVLYNHEGGLDGSDVSIIANAKLPTVLYKHEGGLDGRSE